MMSRAETMKILEQHFKNCVKYWEYNLGVDSDISNEPYKKAIDEIPEFDPTIPNGEKLNKKWVDEFRKYRLMDCYGYNWKDYQKKA